MDLMEIAHHKHDELAIGDRPVIELCSHEGKKSHYYAQHTHALRTHETHPVAT